MSEFYLRNVTIGNEIFRINDYISLIQDPLKKTQTVVKIKDDEDKWLSKSILFYRALQLSIPKIHIYAKVEDNSSGCSIINDLSHIMINYYAKDNTSDITEFNVELKEKDIENLREMFSFVINYNKERYGKDMEPTRWSYAYDCYIDACHAYSIEMSILSIITGLEALLVKGNGELTYRVSLLSSIIARDNLEERKTTFKLIKYMYNLRSKVVHGEVAEVVKNLSRNDIYTKYFELKKIFVDILMKTSEFDENELFNKLDSLLLSAPTF